MATKKISDMTAAASLTGAELVEVVQSGSNVRTTTRSISNLAGVLQPNSQTGNYTTLISDIGKMLTHPSGAGAGDTFAIASNASVAYDIGTAITFVNLDSNSLAIAINSDTMYLAGSVTTGTRTLAQNGVCTALKVDTTVWIISGVGLT